MKQFTVDSREKLDELIEKNADKKVIVLFTGSKNSNGKSWCPDCVVADPIIESVVKEIEDPDVVFITTFVGDLPSWRNDNNPFRKHPTLAVSCVPTLIHLPLKTKLEEGGCADKSLVKKLFEGSLQEAITSKAGTCEGGVCRIR